MRPPPSPRTRTPGRRGRLPSPEHIVRLSWPGRGADPPRPTPTPVSSPVPPAAPWTNRLLHGDNLALLTALAADPDVAASVALAYMDPPFNTGGAFFVGGRGGGRQATATPAYADTWTLDGYLAMMEPRLRALLPLLAPNASVFLHADARVVHYLKVLMDEVMGPRRFVNEIIWHYHSGGTARARYAAKHDTILWYAHGPRPVFHPDAVAVATRAGRRNHMRRTVDENGRPVRTIRSNGRQYTYPDDGRVPPPDVWTDISHLNQRDPERTGYATQKPEALLERIILGSSHPEDLVLDPFCGSGTTLAVAGKTGRRWIGIDASEAAIAVAGRRLERADTGA